MKDPLEGKVIFWLGSSVAYGAAAGGRSMVEALDEAHGSRSIKEAVSGTTLANRKAEGRGESYLARLEKLLASPACPGRVDCAVVQLSTNDMHAPEAFGKVAPREEKRAEAMDRTTTFGASEAILALIREKWGCPILFYTNCHMDCAPYAAMVEGLWEIAKKWDIAVLDLFSDEAFNRIGEDERGRWMADPVHPTQAGYREWWLPKFEEALSVLLGG